jgi:hypothetical protein
MRAPHEGLNVSSYQQRARQQVSTSAFQQEEAEMLTG